MLRENWSLRVPSAKMIETLNRFIFLPAASRYWPDPLGFSFEEAITYSSSFNKGHSYQQKDYKGAEVAFRKISRHPSNDMVHLLLGNVLMQQTS